MSTDETELRTLRLALTNATRAMLDGKDKALMNVHPAIQPLVDAALARIYGVDWEANEWVVDDPKMIFLPPDGPDRRSFRCECGSNVFLPHKTNKRRFKCNGCQATYTGQE